MSNFDYLEDYIESIEGNKITILSGIEENDEMYSFILNTVYLTILQKLQ